LYCTIFFQDEVEEWNQKNVLNRKIDPTCLISPVVTELKWIAKGVIFLDMRRDSFKDFTVRKNTFVPVKRCTE
jgi:hypothetical protein